MTYTLFDLAYRVGREIGGNISVSGTCTGGSSTTIVDTAVLSQSDNAWANGTAFITYDAGGAGAAPQGEYKIISASASASYTVTASSAFTANVAAGDRYFLLKKRYPLHIVIQNINNALMNLGGIAATDTTSIYTVDEQTEHTLPIAANLDLRQVWIQNVNDDANDNKWSLLHNWYVQKTATGSADTLVLPAQYIADYYLKLVYVAPHPELNLYSDKLDESIPLERVVYSAAASCLRWYMDKLGSDDYVSHFNELTTKAEYARLHQSIPIPPRTGKIMLVNRDYVKPDSEVDKVYL